MMAAILNSGFHVGIQTPCYLLSDSLKNTLTPLWLWLKLIQSDSNSFILTQLDDGSHLEFWSWILLNSAILDSAILVFPLKLTHTCQDWFPPFAQKNFTHSFWLNLMMAAILNSAILDSSLIHSDSTWWWQPTLNLQSKLKLTLSFSLNLMMAAILNSATLDLPFSKKNFTHSFWLNLMMAAILNSTILD